MADPPTLISEVRNGTRPDDPDAHALRRLAEIAPDKPIIVVDRNDR